MPFNVQDLLTESAWLHDVDQIRLIETHISWVILTGQFVYKIKKPVDVGFADFTTLQSRRHFCEEELRLNRRLAPDLYLRVVPVCRLGDGQIRVESDLNAPCESSTIIEYAVCMRQFDNDRLLIRMAEQGKLTSEIIDDLGEQVGHFHESIDVAPPDSPFATVAAAVGPPMENFKALHLLCQGGGTPDVAALEQWTMKEGGRLATRFQKRAMDGRIRECHGDMHLGNMFLNPSGHVTVFDGIEFNDAFRWIDVACEVAFTMMDLYDHGQAACAWRFLDRWLQITGDYDALGVLRFYLVYRAVVRCKVDLIRAQQSGVSIQVVTSLCRESTQFLKLAESFTQPVNPAIIITCGPSGSGKTWGSQPLVEQLGFVRIRSDVERKRMVGLSALDTSQSSVGKGLYSSQSSERVYRYLLELAQSVVDSGYGVIVDATFLKSSQRRMFQEWAIQCNLPFIILQFDARPETLIERVRQRAAFGQDASEANEQVIQSQLEHRDVLTPLEQSLVIQGGQQETLQLIQARLDSFQTDIK
ncbi:MAG: AAA family ATPase [Planctomycetaceae bacterium]|nr:AAA family ATPase [Planctomycetaceae bacterium]